MMYKKVKCLILRHQPVSVIEEAKIEKISEGPYGLEVRGRILKAVVKCRRCGKRL